MNYHAASGATSPHADIIRPSKVNAPPLIDDGAFEALADSADMVASLARSIAEAAFRRDTVQLRIYRPEFRGSAAELVVAIRAAAPIEGGRP